MSGSHLFYLTFPLYKLGLSCVAFGSGGFKIWQSLGGGVGQGLDHLSVFWQAPVWTESHVRWPGSKQFLSDEAARLHWADPGDGTHGCVMHSALWPELASYQLNYVFSSYFRVWVVFLISYLYDTSAFASVKWSVILMFLIQVFDDCCVLSLLNSSWFTEYDFQWRVWMSHTISFFNDKQKNNQNQPKWHGYHCTAVIENTNSPIFL